eukprot:4404916-Pyramimonas_sp.AAC.1
MASVADVVLFVHTASMVCWGNLCDSSTIRYWYTTRCYEVVCTVLGYALPCSVILYSGMVGYVVACLVVVVCDMYRSAM